MEEAKTIGWRDVYLYLGLVDDHNPLFLQETYAERTEFERVVVPPNLLGAWLSKLVSMKLPGPGSLVKAMQLHFPHPLFVEEEVVLSLAVSRKLESEKQVTLRATGMSGSKMVVAGELEVCPPRPLKPLFKDAYENF